MTWLALAIARRLTDGRALLQRRPRSVSQLVHRAAILRPPTRKTGGRECPDQFALIDVETSEANLQSSKRSQGIAQAAPNFQLAELASGLEVDFFVRLDHHEAVTAEFRLD